MPPASDPFQLLVFGGSAGAIPALDAIVSKLPGDFSIPIVIVQHLNANHPSDLPRVLGRRTPLLCRWAEEGTAPQAGAVLIAPPGANLMCDGAGRLVSAPGAKPRLGWPSVDVFLRSAATQFGRRLIAVVLSGMLHDGSDGIFAVRRSGGATIVQDPDCAEFPDMPIAAVDFGRADLKLSINGICEAVQILAERGVE